MALDMERLRQWIRSVPHNGLVRYYLPGNVERVLVLGEKELEELLVTKVYHFHKPESIRLKLLRFTGNGILLAEGQEHKRQRRAMLPSFSYRNIKELYPYFWAKALEMSQAIVKEQPHGCLSEPIRVRMSDWASRVTLNIISIAGMGRDFGAIDKPTSELNQQYEKLRLIPTPFTRVLLLLVTLTIGFKAVFWLPTKWNHESLKSAKYIRTHARSILDEKKSKRQAQQEKDITSHVMASEAFSDEQMVDQMMTLLSAGHETIATTVQYAVRALSEHPEMQHRLREEVHSRLPSPTLSSSAITAADMNGMPYLNAFCSEVFRFYPTVPSIMREARIDTSLNNTFIPKGTPLLVLAGVNNFDPDQWGPDPGVFNPDRWIGEGRANNGGCNNHFANLTFIAGPRGCIGQSFAKAELLCLVAVLVGKFQISLQYPDRKLETVRAISEGPKDGTPAILVPIAGW